MVDVIVGVRRCSWLLFRSTGTTCAAGRLGTVVGFMLGVAACAACMSLLVGGSIASVVVVFIAGRSARVDAGRNVAVGASISGWDEAAKLPCILRVQVEMAQTISGGLVGQRQTVSLGWSTEFIVQ